MHHDTVAPASELDHWNTATIQDKYKHDVFMKQVCLQTVLAEEVMYSLTHPALSSYLCIIGTGEKKQDLTPIQTQNNVNSITQNTRIATQTTQLCKYGEHSNTLKSRGSCMLHL